MEGEEAHTSDNAEECGRDTSGLCTRSTRLRALSYPSGLDPMEAWYRPPGHRHVMSYTNTGA
jgi:hypothetical protein